MQLSPSNVHIANRINNNLTRYADKQKIPANCFEKLIERLKKTGLARNVIVDKTAMREYPAKHSNIEVRPMSTSKGEVYGFTTPEGDVYLDPDKMNANTPIHEFGHLFWSSVMPAETKAKITELLKQTPGFTKLLKQVSEWKSLSDNPAYTNLKTDDQKADELFNTLPGNYGEYSPQVRAIMGDYWFVCPDTKCHQRVSGMAEG